MSKAHLLSTGSAQALTLAQKEALPSSRPEFWCEMVLDTEGEQLIFGSKVGFMMSLNDLSEHYQNLLDFLQNPGHTKLKEWAQFFAQEVMRPMMLARLGDIFDIMTPEARDVDGFIKTFNLPSSPFFTLSVRGGTRVRIPLGSSEELVQEALYRLQMHELGEPFPPLRIATEFGNARDLDQPHVDMEKLQTTPMDAEERPLNLRPVPQPEQTPDVDFNEVAMEHESLSWGAMTAHFRKTGDNSYILDMDVVSDFPHLQIVLQDQLDAIESAFAQNMAMLSREELTSQIVHRQFLMALRQAELPFYIAQTMSESMGLLNPAFLGAAQTALGLDLAEMVCALFHIPDVPKLLVTTKFDDMASVSQALIMPSQDQLLEPLASTTIRPSSLPTFVLQ